MLSLFRVKFQRFTIILSEIRQIIIATKLVQELFLHSSTDKAYDCIRYENQFFLAL